MRSFLNCARFVAAVAFALLLLQWSTARGGSIYEPFDYPLNANVAGQGGGTGWLAGSSWQLSQDSAVIVPGLTFTGTKNSLATGGNAVKLTCNGGYPYDCIIGRQIAASSAITSGDLWLSYLVYAPSVDTGNTYEARVNNSAAGWWNPSTFRAIAKYSNTVKPSVAAFGQSATVGNNAISPSTIYFVVAQYQGLATYSGTGKLWVLRPSDLDAINFADGLTPSDFDAHNLSTATVSGTYPQWLDASNYLQFSVSSYPNTRTAIFDELRAGPSVGSVLMLNNPVGNWKNDANGNWSSGTNWSGSIPNVAGSQAIFGSVITAPRTVAVDTPVTVGSLTLDSSNVYTISGTQAITLQASSGNAAINVTSGSHMISAPLTLAGNTNVTVSNSANALTLSGSIGGVSAALNKLGPGTLTLTGNNTYGGGTTISAGTLGIGSGGISGSLAGNVTNNGTLSFNLAGNPSFAGKVSGSGNLVVDGPGVLTLTGSNTYTGGTMVSAGTLQGNTSSLQGDITNNAAVVFNQAADGTYAGSMTGNGSLTKTGGGRLALAGADTFSSSGGIAIGQGILATPFGISRGGSAIDIASGASLEAGGQVKRAISAVGTVTATDDLFIGSSSQSGQFNMGGAPGIGGTLNVGGHAVVILSTDKAILGSQTSLDADGSLMTLNGAQLGNAASSDATKILTATGNATINGDFVNNGLVNGPTIAGTWLTFTQDVKGAGSTTGNIFYAGSYSPGNSPAAVSVENIAFDSTSTLIMEIGGSIPGSQYDHIGVTGVAELHGTLQINLLGSYQPQSDIVCELIRGPTTGQFDQVQGLPSGWRLEYSPSGVNVVPEPSTLALLGMGVVGLLACGWRMRRRNA